MDVAHYEELNLLKNRMEALNCNLDAFLSTEKPCPNAWRSFNKKMK